MDPIATLLMMFLAKGATAPKRKRKARAPKWPTPTSPPPMPAFKPAATPTPADASSTATPLTALHAATTAPAKPPKAAPRRARVPKIVPGMLTSTLPVARLQKALNARGAKLVEDGLYGPKTAAAWARQAASKGLPGTIIRRGPKLADVATHTFDALSFPVIP